MRKSLLLLVLGLGIGYFLQAQTAIEVGDSVGLETVTITSEYAAVSQTPVTFTNLNREELARKSFGQEPSFLLATTPSITAYSDAGSGQGYSYYRIRGIDQTRINMTLDGVPLNEPEDQGVYFSNYPDFLNSVDAVQIQRGVGTTKNGTVSYGGAMLFFSPELARPKQTQVGINYGSFNTYRIYAEHQTGSREGLSAYARGSVVHSDGYKKRSANDSQSLFFSLGLPTGENSEWKLAGFVGHQENEMAWLGVHEDTLAADPRFNANAEEDDEFLQGLIYLQNKTRLTFDSELRSCVYYNFLDGNYDFDFNNFLGLPSTNELYNYAFRSHFFGAYSNLSFNALGAQMTAGIHLNTYGRQHTGSELSLGELYQNTGRRQMASVYFRRERQFKRWTVFGDLQLRYSRFAYDGAVEMPALDWLNLNPTLGATFSMRDNLKFYLSLGRVTREPTRNDVFGGNDDLLADSLGQPLLFITDPERVGNIELGMRLKHKAAYVNANLFFMRFQNEIQLNGQFGPNGLALTRATARSVRTGVELDAGYTFPFGLQLVNRSSFGMYRISEGGVEFEPVLSPAVLVNQEINYQKNGWSFGLAFRAQSASWIDFSNTSELSGYAVLNGFAGYRWKGWQLTLRGQNLTDQQYFNNGYLGFDGSQRLFVQAPRSGNLELTWTF